MDESGTGSGGWSGGGDSGDSEGGVDSGASGSGGSGSSDSGSGGDGDGDGDSGGPRFDVGSGSSGGSAGESSGEGCEKVDFLFVVDNSGSMEGEQINLANSFPGFIDAIQSEVGITDFHIMVIDTDGVAIEELDCGGLPACCAAACGTGAIGACDGVPCPGDPCNFEGGAARINDQNGAPCPIAPGRRYIVEGQPDLATTFQCVAQVGTGGNGDEKQMEATLAAIGPELNQAGACNEGFLRDDAVLVITIISDEEDDPNDGGMVDMDANSPGDPASWRADVVAAKNGDEGAVVALALVGDTDLPSPECEPPNTADVGTGAEPAPRLRQFAESFPFGQSGSVCADDYAPFFSSAISVISTACDEFVPPG